MRVLGSVIEASDRAVLGIGWRGITAARVGLGAGAVGVRCARRARTLERGAAPADEGPAAPQDDGAEERPQSGRSAPPGRQQSDCCLRDKDPGFSATSVTR